MTTGLILAAPASGSGKTVLTAGLVRALRARGLSVGTFKTGPDYIDAAFLAAAAGRPCQNLDPWAMRAGTVAAALSDAADGADIAIGEGVMGLFDGAADGSGSTADLAARLGLPVALVVDAARQGASAGALLHGFRTWRDDVTVAGVLFNRVGSERHAALLSRAANDAGLPLLGLIPGRADLALPSRHLGLVQAAERDDLAAFLDRAAGLVAAHADLDAIADLARPVAGAAPIKLKPPGRCIAVARDIAFAFVYEHLLAGWRRAGAAFSFFSPLADEAPGDDADAVFLPGGYPELHAARLSANRCFLGGLREAAARGAVVYGECGGYMVLGESLTDADGRCHRMAGLLPLHANFALRRRQLGYRDLELCCDTPLGPAGARLRGHEFHYATIVHEGEGTPLFRGRDATDIELGPMGRVRGTVMGSFAHLIDQVD